MEYVVKGKGVHPNFFLQCWGVSLISGPSLWGHPYAHFDDHGPLCASRTRKEYEVTLSVYVERIEEV